MTKRKSLQKWHYTGYPLKLYFQIPCVFPVQPQIFPVPIYIICDYYIHKTDLADLSSFWIKMEIFTANIDFTLRKKLKNLPPPPKKIGNCKKRVPLSTYLVTRPLDRKHTFLVALESGNLQLEQTKFPVFWQIFQIPCVFPDRKLF